MKKKKTKSETTLIKDPFVVGMILIVTIWGILLFVFSFNFSNTTIDYIEKGFQLTLACTLGSLIGLEREYRQRPAGVRTYALVCIGATLIMVISFDIFDRFHQVANFDPARLGAQVVSGIGFLGAGTIIHNKTSVKGLTTAAGLWVVSSIGLAIGSKMYFEAIIYFSVVYFILHYFSSVERRLMLKNNSIRFTIVSKDRSGCIGEIGQIFGKHNIKIKSIEIERDEEEEVQEEEEIGDQDIHIVLTADIPTWIDVNSLKNELMDIEGVLSVLTSKR